MKNYMLFICLCLSIPASAQRIIKVSDATTGEPVPAVNIRDRSHLLAITDTTGTATIQLTDSAQIILLSKLGYSEQATDLRPRDTTTLLIRMVKDENNLEEVTVVATTRNNENIENSPMKIEVLGKEELSEEAGIKPGNIGSILSDVSGVQVQQSSAATGNSNLRIQGLDGRYTQILRDGMPLYDGFSGGLGIMTIPPLDLQQIELIKGSASTLYGGGAIGGLVNLISKKPAFRQEADVLVNYTTLKEFNANAYVANRNKKLGYTLFTGYTRQNAVDVDKDGFSDVPDIHSVVVHPRLFFYPSDKTIITVGYTGTFDNRKGGDMQVLDGNADALHQYYERNISQRHTGAYIVEHYRNSTEKIVWKGNYSHFSKQTTTNAYDLKGDQSSYYNELSLLKSFGAGSLVAGVNITGNRYQTRYPDTLALQSFSNFTAGAFAQFSWHIRERSILEAGLRADHHNRYGFFLLPRIALFHRFNDHWATRMGLGAGYKTPNPLVQQNVEYDLPDIRPAGDQVHAEYSYGYNVEGNYKKVWGTHKQLFINQALFLTRVNDPIVFTQAADNSITMSNAGSPLISMGSDTYVQFHWDSWELYLGYTYTDARRTYLPENRFVPLTPRNRMAFVAVKEWGAQWRVGIEGSYFGTQYRYDGSSTPDYFFLALMIQRNFGEHFSIVLNGENMLDYRMSKEEGLYTGTITHPSFKPLWAPIDGRVINFSLRWKL